MTHRQLVQDLALLFWPDRLVFAEPSIGSRWLQNGVVSVPDVLTLNKSFTHPVPSIYEVKVSRADFDSDVVGGKWLRYLPYCCRFYFACPAGMVGVKDLPDGAGLIVRGDVGWAVKKAAKTREATGWTQVDVMSLLMSGAFTGVTLRDLRARVDMDAEFGSRVKGLGYEVARCLSQLKAGEQVGENGWVLSVVADVLAVSSLDVIAMGASGLRDRLCDRLGLTSGLLLLAGVANAMRSSWSSSVTEAVEQAVTRWKKCKEDKV